MEIANKLLDYPEAALLFCALVYVIYSWLRKASSESFLSFLATIGKYGAITGGSFLLFGLLIAFTPFGENQLGPLIGVLFYAPLGLLLGIMFGAIIWLSQRTTQKTNVK